MRFFVITCALVWLIVFLAPQRVNAQIHGKGFTVIPPSFTLTLLPGKIITQAINVENVTDEPLIITVDRRNFTAQGEEGAVSLLPVERASFSLASWINVSPNRVTLPPKGKQEFVFTINTPVTAESGGHFGSIVFVSTPPKDSTLAGSGAYLSQEIGILILATVPGVVREEANIVSFQSDKSFYDSGPVTFTLRVKNNGNIHVRPAGTVTITDMLGRKTVLPLPEQNVLPRAIRRTNLTWQQQFLLGKYTVNLIAAYGSKNQNLTASVVFYAFPVLYGVIFVAIVLLLILMRKRLTKAFRVLVGKE